MDQHTVEIICRPRTRADIPAWQAGDAYLAGGSWLLSEPLPDLRRFVDLTTLGWQPTICSDDGLSIAATCTFAELRAAQLPASWTAKPLIDQCCRALLGSFKVWNVATVGGNLCMALPAGPLIALAHALDADCVIWTPDGGERRLPIDAFILGPQHTALRSGEILCGIEISSAALRRKTAFRRISLSPAGRSGALLIGTLDSVGACAITVTAATRRPLRLVVPRDGTARELQSAIAAAITSDDWYDDVHGAPAWRAHVTTLLAAEIHAELYAGCGA